MKKTVLSTILLCSLGFSHAAIWYVSDTPAGLMDGSSWANASANLQNVIDGASTTDEIWVEAGTYLCPGVGFNLRDGISLYGGFVGTETLRSQRNSAMNLTILSGNLGNPVDQYDNAPLVVNIVGVGAGTEFSGFVIRDGYNSQTNNNVAYASGINVYDSDLTLSELLITENYAIASTGYMGMPGMMGDCGFGSGDGGPGSDGGQGYDTYGGGMLISGLSAPTLSNCIFASNYAYGGNGGEGGMGGMGDFNCGGIMGPQGNGGAGGSAYGAALCIDPDVNIRIENCVFYQNVGAGGYVGTGGFGFALAGNANGTIANYGRMDFINSLVTGNEFSQGNALYAGIYNLSPFGNTDVLLNSIIRNNQPNTYQLSYLYYDYSSVNTSNIEGGYAGTGVIDADPMFLNSASPMGGDFRWRTADDGYRLSLGSPSINAGTNAGAPGLDILANANVGSNKDHGPYEYLKTTVMLSTANTASVANYEFTDLGGWTHYYNTASSPTQDILLLSVFKNGENIGMVGDGTFEVTANTTAAYNTGAGTNVSAPSAPYASPTFTVMNQWWNVVPNPQLPGTATGVKVRTYYDPATALADINGSLSVDISTDTELKFYKINGSSSDLNSPTPHAGVNVATDCGATGIVLYDYAATGSADCNTWIKGSHQGITYGEIEVKSFSGGGGGSSGGVLPIELLSFEAKALENANLLSWTSATEINASHYAIEKSSDAQIFTVIENINAVGNSTTQKHYQYADASISSPVSYYRLKMIDLDGTYSYSNVVELSREQSKADFAIFPNPAKNQASLSGNFKTGTQIFVVNLLGQTLETKTAVNEETQISLNLENIPAGIYYVKVVNAKGKLENSQKLIVE